MAWFPRKRRPVFLLCMAAMVACASAPPAPPVAAERAPEVALPPPIKNVIILIGDGMGPQQVGLLEAYASRAPRSVYAGNPTAIHRLMDESTVALSRHHPADGVVVDSACSATQLASGKFAGLEMVGLDAEGHVATTIVEIAEEAGKSTGLVSDVRLTHATPAAFAAHVAHRTMENEIAEQMAVSGVDVMLSGGLRHWVPQKYDPVAVQAQTGASFDLGGSKRKDDRDLLAEVQTAGYSLAFDRESLASAGDRVLGLFSWGEMADGITHTATRESDERTEPTLAEMTLAALERLDKNPNGFVLMVEGGQIDWAGHANDTGYLLHEMLKFDEAIGAVHEWVAKRGEEDTLVLLTADHETGSFGLSYRRNDLPEPQTLPGKGFEGHEYRPNFNFGRVEELDGIFEQTQTLGEIIDDFEAQASKIRVKSKRAKARAKILMRIFNEASAFDITLAQAERVLQTEPNAHRIEGNYRDDKPHSSLASESLPRFDEFEEFYPYGERDITALLGRAVAAQQGVVWGTGTHTHTPVPVVTFGPEHVRARFSGLFHHVELGQMLIDVVKAGK